MPQEEENYVALFVDWDNLAISTSVDFGGAVPDVRAIVRAAQRFGTVVLARAYAEWNVNSDRLSVYRSGVEPVYAPIFRFEPEPGSGMPRGKSLADPCMVTDSIDVMHLMPNINVFVLVSGDKDLIPVVRLAQLRSKKVVVIGPDFVAQVLREMADEYIPYRGLIETAEATAAPEIAAPSRSGRRLHGSSSRSSQLTSGTTTRHVSQPTPSQRSAPAATSTRAAPVEPAVAEAAVPPTVPTSPVAPVISPAAAVAATPPAVPEPVIEPPAPDEASQEAGPLFDMIRSILREREEAGKPRLRATNLKDQLLARIPGFNERRYGFSRFKDLLASAEKAGVLNVTRTGPVQWVTLASLSAPAPTAVAPTAALETVGATAPESPVAEEPIDDDIIRFILDLRDRSRWLTYTYVLTNLLNHLGKGVADAAADAAARAALNRLVSSGVLVVDREPREIDVNGTKHRVRLCHVVNEHPLVSRMDSGVAAGEANDVANEPTDVLTVSETRELAAPAQESSSSEVAAASEERGAAVSAASQSAPTEPASPVIEMGPAREAEAPGEPAASVGEATSRPRESAAEEAPSTSASQSVEASEPAVAREEAPAGETEPVAAEGEGTSRARGAENGVVPNPPLTLTESYDILRDVVREATGPNRPSTGPAAVKNRLVRRLGAFDEHAFGFSKFKDYLLAAEKAGAVKVEVVGTTARVSLPSEA